MHALIDGDILVYRAGFGAASKVQNPPLSHCLKNLRSMVGAQLGYLNKYFEVDRVTIFVSSDDKTNFRYRVATIKPYKGNRTDSQKPPHYAKMKDYLCRRWKAKLVKGMEADDEIGIISQQGIGYYIICSADKDLRMLEGWHWEMNDEEPYYITDPGILKLIRINGKKPKLKGGGFAWFAAQMLLGDTADNIPGIKGYGDVRVYDVLKDCGTISEYVATVSNIYYNTYGPSYYDRLKEVGQLLWILRSRCEIPMNSLSGIA